MRYRTNDAVIDIPDDWHDQTLHIFSSEQPGKAGYTIVITSEQLDRVADGAGYRDMALQRLPKELPGFSLVKELATVIMSTLPCYVLEYTWNSPNGVMHHFQALFATKQSQRLLKGYSITMSIPEDLFHPDLELLFARTIRSYTFDQ
ncbi:DcrB-related protein [Spirosoma sp.]|uniref:DcrB-related protein n=1 Tax=Spirosoma sp. TaxID=1899569 RepID=UPI002634CCB8|nr:DcrB-related protein [Spirosoma sp.]MCX6216959.1 DcrB-related protein [Spirosoma sp.]